MFQMTLISQNITHCLCARFFRRLSHWTARHVIMFRANSQSARRGGVSSQGGGSV